MRPCFQNFRLLSNTNPLNSYLTFRCEPWTLTTRFNLNLCVLPAGAAKKLQQDLRSCAPLCDLQSNGFLIVPAGLCAITIVICVPTPKGLRRAESSLGPPAVVCVTAIVICTATVICTARARHHKNSALRGSGCAELIEGSSHHRFVDIAYLE